MSHTLWVPIRAWLLLLLLLCAPWAPADALDELLAREMAERHIPGLSLTLIREGKVVDERFLGVASVELGVPVTRDSVFQVGSITKCFTAAVCQILEREGVWRLTDPASRWVDGLPTGWAEVTLGDLLSHTSGLDDWRGFDAFSFGTDYTSTAFFELFGARQPNLEPGTRYQYSSVGYALLGMAIERATGQSFDKVIAERVFRPLGMSQSRIVPYSEVVPNRVAGYQFREGRNLNGFPLRGRLTAPSGGALSTSGDLARFLNATDEEVLLRREEWLQAWTPRRLMGGTSAPYGLGWNLSPIRGMAAQKHTGTTPGGFRAMLLRLPERQFGLVLLINQSETDVTELTERILDVVLQKSELRRAA